MRPEARASVLVFNFFFDQVLTKVLEKPLVFLYPLQHDNDQIKVVCMRSASGIHTLTPALLS